jgi:hypothetical protein
MIERDPARRAIWIKTFTETIVTFYGESIRSSARRWAQDALDRTSLEDDPIAEAVLAMEGMS